MTSPSIEAPANLGVIRSAGDDLRGRELGELCEPRLGLAPMEVRFQTIELPADKERAATARIT